MKIAKSLSRLVFGLRESAKSVLPRVGLVAIDNGDSARKAAVFTESGETLDVRDRTNGQVAIPALIVVKDDGEVLTGFAAEHVAKLYPRRVIRDWKSALGTDEVVAHIEGKPYTARWCAEQMMRDALASAAIPLGVRPRACVLTHKGNATQAHLADLKAGAEAIGLEVIGLIAESTAAVYGYDAFETGKRYVAVSDWGSSTHDLTILEVNDDGTVKVVAVVGTAAGGSRVTNELIERCVDGFAAQMGFLPHPESTPEALWDLREQCEQTKLAFAVSDSGLVVVRDGARVFQQEFTLEEFLSCVEPVEAEVFAAIDGALADQGIDPTEVHWVGAGRAIRTRGHVERFEKRYGKLHCDLDSDTAISRGALLYAAKLVSEQGRAARFENLPAATELASLEDVNHRAFGIIINRWKAPRSGPIPTRQRDVDPSKTYSCLDAILDRWQPLGRNQASTYSPTYREQGEVQIQIAEGPKDGAHPKDCEVLGSFDLQLVPSADRDCIGRIEVRVEVDAESKLVTVIARDLYGPEDQTASGTVQWEAAPRPKARIPQAV